MVPLGSRPSSPRGHEHSPEHPCGDRMAGPACPMPRFRLIAGEVPCGPQPPFQVYPPHTACPSCSTHANTHLETEHVLRGMRTHQAPPTRARTHTRAHSCTDIHSCPLCSSAAEAHLAPSQDPGPPRAPGAQSQLGVGEKAWDLQGPLAYGPPQRTWGSLWSLKPTGRQGGHQVPLGPRLKVSRTWVHSTNENGARQTRTVGHPKTGQAQHSRGRDTGPGDSPPRAHTLGPRRGPGGVDRQAWSIPGDWEGVAGADA